MRRIFCLIFGHKYFRVKQLTDDSLLVGCKRCKKYYGMNKSVCAILPFDKEMEEMYRKVFHIRGLKKYLTKDSLFNLITG